MTMRLSNVAIAICLTASLMGSSGCSAYQRAAAFGRSALSVVRPTCAWLGVRPEFERKQGAAPNFDFTALQGVEVWLALPTMDCDAASGSASEEPFLGFIPNGLMRGTVIKLHQDAFDRAVKERGLSPVK
jgi:hypothetical protein